MRKFLIAAVAMSIAGAVFAGSYEDQRAADQRRAEDFSAQMDRDAPKPSPIPPLDTRISDAKRCVAQNDAQIKRQHEIGREVGVVDKNALYQAGVGKIACRNRLAMLEKCKKTGACPADPWYPDASRSSTNTP